MDDSTGSEWTMLPSSSNHEQQQQQQQQEKKASQLFAQRALQERRLKPPDQVIACPRCQSLNTKFCYYNNYSLTQPRHFCKSCRRYWTAGGTLRNVPVGGGCRKNKRTKPRTPDAASSGGAVSSDSDHSLSVGPGLQHHQGFGGSGGYLDSSEGSYAGVEQSVRVTQDPSGEGSLSFPFHLSQPTPLSQHMHMHPFEAGIPGINFFRGPRPETTLNLHPSPGDLSSIFDTSNVPRPGGLTSSLSEGLVSFSSNHPGYPVAGVDQQSSTYAGLEAWRAHQAQHQHAHAPSSVWGNEAMQGEVDMKRQQVNF